MPKFKIVFKRCPLNWANDVAHALTLYAAKEGIQKQEALDRLLRNSLKLKPVKKSK